MKSPEMGDTPVVAQGAPDEPTYVSLRPSALAVNKLPAYSFETEQYRILALQIEERFEDENDGPHILAVTGPDPSSGKTLTSLNLALTLARRGERKVLLVEGDLWKPSFSSLFQIQEGTVGLSDLLRNDDLELDPALLTVWGTGLSLLVAGARGEEGDLVTSRRMDQLVAAMRSKYDLIVFDTPPFGLASSRYLNSIADSTVVVVRAGKTNKRAIRETLDGLQPEQVAGLVLNDVQDRQRNYAYYSSYAAYYGGGYGPEPLGWRKNLWKRPLAGVAAAVTAAGALAASLFSLLRGKPAAAAIEPAWLVAGFLLLLTVVSWAVALSKWRPSDGQRTAAIVDQTDSGAGLTDRRQTESETPTAGATSAMPRDRPDAATPSPTSADEPEEIRFTLRAVETPEPEVDAMPANRGITITNLNIRRQPALDGDYLATLPRGTSFEILDRDDDWLRVRAGDRVGWVAKLGTEIGPDGASPSERVGSVARQGVATASEIPAVGGARTITNLNLRSLPGREGPYLTTLSEGTSLEIREEQDGWYRVRAGDQAGWVLGRGVALGGDSVPSGVEPEREQQSAIAVSSDAFGSGSGQDDESGAMAEVAGIPVGPPIGTGTTLTNLNLRGLPGREGPYLTTLPEGTFLEILEERDGWYRVRAGDRAGWVLSRGVKEDRRPSAASDLPEESLQEPEATATATLAPALLPPKFIGWTAPTIRETRDSRGAGETLLAAVLVTESGEVVATRLVESDRTDDDFNHAVLESLRSARFRPAFENGIAVESWHNLRVRYQQSS